VEYEVGAEFPAGDGCNTCRCAGDGELVCTLASCEDPPPPPPPARCRRGGEAWEEGDVFPDGDGCNVCTCGVDGETRCTRGDCWPEGGAAESHCWVDGAWYDLGEGFLVMDGCGLCACGESTEFVCVDLPCDRCEGLPRDVDLRLEPVCALREDPYEHRSGCVDDVQGVPEGTIVSNRSGRRPHVLPSCGYSWGDDLACAGELVASAAEELTGLQLTTFQGCNEADGFAIHTR